ncbi:MAG: ferrous iron transport protein B [Deltaproteobacteria bacterium]|nr:ferrous iron transport protein B [Deltaproteobacteria bacterium]MBN2672895.1 ferrous iron transport protein B [Deltaproteobacteria bacterium]
MSRTNSDTGVLQVALAGSPNCGKTSLFNGLTGSRQHVGNYAGVTVERRNGYYTFDGQKVEVRDLPGSYSLSSFSPEEMIAQRELVDERPDVVVVVVDSTSLKRSLVLLAQVMQNSKKIVLCLNMSDEAKKSGQKIDIPLLTKLLGFPVVETVGHKNVGLDQLKERIAEAAAAQPRKSRLMLGERLERAIDHVADALQSTEAPNDARQWYAVKILQNDPLFVNRILEMGAAGKAVLDIAEKEREQLESFTGEDVSMYVTERYYGFVDGLLREVTIQVSHIDTRILSDRIDAIVVHRIMGIPIFLAVMYGIFWLTFTAGAYPMDWIDQFFGFLADTIVAYWPQNQAFEVQSLIVDGIIGGVGGVLVFLPNIVLLFLGLAILQDSGYMSRAAFLTDKLMHKFGLHGRSFIPLVTGFGCTIPGIMATRTMENERDRLATMLVLPLMSCGARLPIWMLLIPAFFVPALHAPMLFAIYFIGIFLAFLLALLLRNTVLKGEEAPFVMELPPYRLPTLRSVVSRMMMSSWAYLKKAGTMILGISIVMWALTTYPKYSDPADTGDAVPVAAADTASADKEASFKQLEHSIAGRIGKFIEPVIAPLGFDWKIGVATIGAFTAKEVFVSQLGVIYALGEDTSETDLTLRDELAQDYSPLIGFSLMLFLLIATPCMATVAITKKESGSWKWPALQFFGLTAIAYLLSLLVFQIGTLLGL